MDKLLCDNWRGIRLLDVMGKIFARVTNDRLILNMGLAMEEGVIIYVFPVNRKGHNTQHLNVFIACGSL